MTAVLVGAVRAGLRELADVEFQRRVWTGRGVPDEMSSFEEAVATLFDDSGLAIDLDGKRPVFGQDVDLELGALRDLLQHIDPIRDPGEIIDDPQMNSVRQRAAAVLDLIPT